MVWNCFLKARYLYSSQKWLCTLWVFWVWPLYFAVSKDIVISISFPRKEERCAEGPLPLPAGVVTWVADILCPITAVTASSCGCSHIAPCRWHVQGLTALTARRFETAKSSRCFKHRSSAERCRWGQAHLTAGRQPWAAQPRVQETILENSTRESLFAVCPVQAAGAFRLFHLYHLKAAWFSTWKLFILFHVLLRGWGGGNESARSARADKCNACLLSITHSALSTRMYYFFPMHSHTWAVCGRSKCHHCAL